jgi:hypothetical protein
MRPSIFGAIAIALAVTGCGTAPQDPPQEQKIAQPTAAPRTTTTPPTPTGAAGSASVDPPASDDPPSIIPVPGVPTVAPPIQGSPQTRQPYVYSPGPSPPTSQYSQPLNRGPVTGYGPGGLAQPPGAPSNPPFHYAP